MIIKGNLVNLFTEEIYPAEIQIEKGNICCIRKIREDVDNFLLPGLIDAHIHIESSLLTPSRFAQAVVPHGTTGVVSDPHEIANVLGMEGIKYMIQEARSVPLRVYYTAPSCVPATTFETSGAVLGSEEMDELLKMDDIIALGEMMNFPGVLVNDPLVMEKIRLAKKHNKPIDGHAPLLSGRDLCLYIAAGISTDHECSRLDEAQEKKRLGMKIMLRDGSSAQNLEELLPVGGDFIVSDDRHPQDLLNGHLDQILKKAVQLGLDPLKAIKMVTINPSEHYNLDTGTLTPGSKADIIMVEDLKDFNVKRVWIDGEIVAKDGKALFKVKPLTLKSTFQLNPKQSDDFETESSQDRVKVRVIKVLEGQILTEEIEADLNVKQNKIQPDLENDILKIAVVERYGHNRIFSAFVNGFNLKNGAIASSVAHDSHNIIVVGTDTQKMAQATNLLIATGGGLATVTETDEFVVKLPIAGLMTTKPVYKLSKDIEKINQIVNNMGCGLESPFMTLSFMALLVIPKLKISDMGLFDGESFQYVNLIK